MKKLLRRTKKRLFGQAQTALGPNFTSEAQRFGAYPDPPSGPIASNKSNKDSDQAEERQNLPTHIHRLPSELLAKILQYDLHDLRYGASNLKWMGPRRPISRVILLSSVCSYWRELVTETGSFWSYIILSGGNPGLETLASLCIERAKDNLLDIVVICSTGLGAWDLSRTSMLSNHTHKFRSLSLLLRARVKPYALLRFLGLDSPSSLSELSVTCSPISTDQYPSSGTPISLFYTTQGDDLTPGFGELIKRLHVLDLTDAYLNWKQHTFDQLHTLKLKGRCSFYSIAQLIHVLSTSPQLRTLSITWLSELTEDTTTTTSLMFLPNLRNVHLNLLGFGALYPILQALPAGPYSIELFIHTDHFDAFSMHQHEPREMIDRLSASFGTFPGITTLRIVIGTNLWGLAGWFQHIIRSLPNLNTLILSHTNMNTHLISRLVSQGPTSDAKLGGPLPRIVALKLRCVKLVAVQEFKDMISSYFLKEIELDHCDLVQDLSPDSLQPFERYWANPPTVPVVPGSELHGWLLKTVPKVSILHRNTNYVN